MRSIIGILVVLFAASSCSRPGQDSHTEVFKTAEAMREDRLAKQLQSHKELAVSLLRFSRPDIEAAIEAGTTIALKADGVSRQLDLAPIESDLLHNENAQRTILRRYLDAQLRAFDVDRVKSLGAERTKKLLAFQLINGRDLNDLQKLLADAKPRSAQVMANLYRVTVVRRENPLVIVPVTDGIIEAWHAAAAEVDAAAMQNLRDSIGQPADQWMETVSFGVAGRSGNLKSGVDPAVILLPEFLTGVRHAWNTDDDLVICAPSPTSISFIERKNERLLNSMVPNWRKLIAATPNPLCDQLLLREMEMLSSFIYIPRATQPATVPATEPPPYIVH